MLNVSPSDALEVTRIDTRETADRAWESGDAMGDNPFFGDVKGLATVPVVTIRRDLSSISTPRSDLGLRASSVPLARRSDTLRDVGDKVDVGADAAGEACFGASVVNISGVLEIMILVDEFVLLNSSD